MSRVACCAALCASIASCSSGPPPGPFQGKTPVEIFNAVVSAIRDSGSVHALQDNGDGTTETYDVSESSGRLLINEDPDVMEVRMVGEVAYAKGNKDALADIVGASDSVAKKYAGRWIQFSRDDVSYEDLADGVTLSSFITDLGFSGAISVGRPLTVGVTRVVGLYGPLTTGGQGTLYVPVKGPPLPVLESGNDQGSSFRMDFSNWGEQVTVTIPGGAIGASTIGL